MRSHRMEKQSEDILALWAAYKDITLEELRAAVANISLAVFAIQ